jgi:hypothetical protein
VSIQSRHVTPQMVEANRENAQKSTGPRTPEGKQRVNYNALRHGLYGKPCMQFMLAADEDPKEHQQILAGLTDSFHPFTPAQQMLVEDLAMLRWEKRRNQRSQAAAISFEMEQLDISTEELRKQRDRDDSGMSFDRAAVEQKGLISMPDCPAKFRQIRESLKLLLDQVDRKQFKIDASSTLLLLYGHQPSLRGNFLCARFDRFLTQEPNDVEHEQLRVAVIDELIEWTQKYQTFMRRHMEVSPARRDLCFAPTEAKWRLILRQEVGIDRQIERKTRLLWEMQEVDRQRRQDEEWQEIVQQEAESAQAREAEARAQEAEQARMIEEAAAEIGERLKKIQEQSRQAAENKGQCRIQSRTRRREARGGRPEAPRIRDSEFRIPEVSRIQGSEFRILAHGFWIRQKSPDRLNCERLNPESKQANERLRG